MTLNGIMALFCVISANLVAFGAHCVIVHVRYLISWWVLVCSICVLILYVPFLPRDAMLARYNAMALCPSVRPFVHHIRPSQDGSLLSLYENTKHRITKTTDTIAQRLCSVLIPKIFLRNSNGIMNHPQLGRQIQTSWVRIRDFRPISSHVHVGNGAR